MADIRYVDYAGIELGKTSSSVNTIDGTVGYDDLVGTATHDLLRANGSLVNTLSSVADRLAGGLGDDYYNISSSSVQVVERAGEGIDTVRTVANYVLADNVEILLVQGTTGSSGTTGIGNGLANVIMGDTLGQMLDGRGGNDVITGGGGGDTFIFQAGSGHDVVTDFFTGTKAARVSLADYGFKSFGEIAGAMTQAGADVRLRLSDTDSITFRNATVNRFTAASFTTALDKSGMKIAFNDEFEGAPELFDFSTGGGKWLTSYVWGNEPDARVSRSLGAVNGERQIYVDPTYNGTGSAPLNLNPFSVHDGVLDIKATPMQDGMKSSLHNYDYTSGLLTSRASFTQTYGYFEARLKLPSSQGAWPAFWLYTSAAGNQSEIDIMESTGGTPSTVKSLVHDSSLPNSVSPTGQSYIADAASQFHAYGVKWDSEHVTYYIDGRQTYQIDTPANMHRPMYLILNLAVGAAGGKPSVDQFPATYSVDYVRAYSLAPNQLPVGDPQVTGTADADILHTGSATQVMDGLGGDDTYYVNDADVNIVEGAGGGNDQVITSLLRYTLGSNVENLVYSGASAFIGKGNELANTIIGGDETDWLSGGGGSDSLIGGKGSDNYFVDSPYDTVTEKSNEGADVVYSSSARYTLATGQEIETLTGTGAAGTLVGNEFANRIIGTNGVNKIDGGASADTMEGRGGNDVYFIENTLDKVIEKENDGYDGIQTVLPSFSLPANVETLTYVAGGGNFIGIGNSAANLITGGPGNDILNGYGGTDMLVGKGGDDGYFVDNPGVIIIEKPGEGFDFELVTINAASAGQDVELMLFRGTGDFTGYASRQGTQIEGGSGDDMLWGNVGPDTLNGLGGNNLYRGGDGADRFIFSAPGTGTARIVDFRHGDDQLVLDAASFNVDGMDDLRFFLNGEKGDMDGHPTFLYNKSGNLYFNPTGDENGSPIFIAKFDYKPSLDASDFLIA